MNKFLKCMAAFTVASTITITACISGYSEEIAEDKPVAEEAAAEELTEEETVTEEITEEESAAEESAAEDDIVFEEIISNQDVSYCSGGCALQHSTRIQVAAPGGDLTLEVTGPNTDLFGNGKPPYYKTILTYVDEGVTEIRNVFFETSKDDRIYNGALSNLPNLKVVDLYNYNGTVAPNTFENDNALEKLMFYYTNEVHLSTLDGCNADNLTIYCEPYSSAHSMAESNNYKYKLMRHAPYTELEEKIFDLDTYIANNPDVVEEVGTDETDLYNHWIYIGMINGKKGSKIFDPKYYIEHNPDVKAAVGTNYLAAYNHFIDHGYAEGRKAIADPDENTTELTTAENTENTTAENTEITTAETTAAAAESSSETTTAEIRHGGGGGGGSVKIYTTTTEATTVTATETATEASTESTTEKGTEETTQNTPADVKITIGSRKILIGDKEYAVDAAPYIQAESNSTLVPLRFAAIAISGGNVENADTSSIISWDPNTKTAAVKAGKKTVSFTAGSNAMITDGKPSPMENDVKAEIKDGRMYIPFRALGNALGVKVEWDADTKTAIYKV